MCFKNFPIRHIISETFFVRLYTKYFSYVYQFHFFSYSNISSPLLSEACIPFTLSTSHRFIWFSILLLKLIEVHFLQNIREWNATEKKKCSKKCKWFLPLAVGIFADLTEGSNGKEIEACDWSNLRFDKPPPKSKNME